MANRFPLEYGFAEKDPEAVSRIYRKECCDRLVMFVEMEGGWGEKKSGSLPTRLFSIVFCSKPIIKNVFETQ